MLISELAYHHNHHHHHRSGIFEPYGPYNVVSVKQI